MNNLHAMAAGFAEKWAPDGPAYHEFLNDLRELLEAYGRAALRHQSFPDTEHQHGEPI